MKECERNTVFAVKTCPRSEPEMTPSMIYRLYRLVHGGQKVNLHDGLSEIIATITTLALVFLPTYTKPPGHLELNIHQVKTYAP